MQRFSLFAAAAAACLAACGGSASSDKVPADAARSAITHAAPDQPELASNEGQIIIDDHAVIRRGAVGPLRVGEWQRPATSWVYVVGANAGPDSSAIITVRGIGKDTLTLTFENDTLRRIIVTRHGPRTKEGYGVGTPFDTIANRADAVTVTRDGARVATLGSMCGVTFATDSAALDSGSASRLKHADSLIVRAISVGPCTKH